MRGFVRAVTGVGLATILYKTLAALQQLLLARVLGATEAADAFFMAQVLPLLLAGLLFNALSSSTVFLMREDRDSSAVAGMLLQAIAAISVACGALQLAGPWILRLMAPAASPDLLEQAGSIQFILMPVFLFQAIGGVLTGVLLSRRILVAPPLSMCLMYGCGLAGLWLTHDGSAKRLAIGLAAGALLQASALALFLGRGVWVKPRFDFRLGEGLFFQALPALGCNAISTLLLVTDRSFASGFGPGQLAAISYVYSLVTMPTQIVVNTVVGVSMPGWVKAGADLPRFSEAVTRALALLSFALLPVAICMTLGAAPITALALGSTRFTPDQISATASLLAAYSPAIVGFAAKDALTAAALAQGKAGWALAIGLAGVALALLLKWLLAPGFGMRAAAIGTCAGLGACTLALISILSSREIPRRYWRYSKETVLASAPALLIGLIAAALTRNAWTSVATAMAGYVVFWYLLGGATSSLQLLRGDGNRQC